MKTQRVSTPESVTKAKWSALILSLAAAGGTFAACSAHDDAASSTSGLEGNLDTRDRMPIRTYLK